MVHVTRRTLLHATGAGGAIALSGCLGTGMPGDAVAAATPVEMVPDDATTLDMGSLPAAEQQLLQTAIEDGYYHECEVSDATRSFAGRIEGGPDTTYLARGDARYGLWVRVDDVVYADTGGSPPETPDCGGVL